MYCESLAGGRRQVLKGHVPVLLDEVIEVLGSSRACARKYLDLTFGGGGHTREILERIPDSKVVAFDQDPSAVTRADLLRKNFSERLRFEARNFEEMGIIQDTGYTGVLMDLGVSSYQLDEVDRGFSFREDAPMDMRMNTSQGKTAAEFLENASLEAIETAIREFGEESRWRAISRAIVEARGTGILSRTSSFAALVTQHASRPAPGRRRIHPATQTFQGIRIAVNRELECLDKTLPLAFEKLAPDGVLAVISFHSIEDRIVKRFFKKLAGRPEHKNDNRTQDQRKALAEIITRKPIIPSDQEILDNPRARSAKLRVIRKHPEGGLV